MDKKDKTVKSIGRASIFTILLGILVPGAYLIGVCYYDGTLRAYGLDYESFPISGPDVYVIAYTAFGHFLLGIGLLIASLFETIFRPPGVYWALGIFLLLLFLVYQILIYSKNKKPLRKRKLYNILARVTSYLHWKNNSFTKALAIVVVPSYGAITALYLVVIICLFWWLIPLAAGKKAQQLENEKIADFQAHGCYVKEKQPWNNCFSLLDEKGQELVSGLLVAITQDRIAFFVKDGPVVLDIPKVYRLKRAYAGTAQHTKPIKSM